MNLIALFTLLTFVIFWGIRFREGVPSSLSDDFYRLKAKGKSHYFDAFFLIIGLSMWFYGLYDYKDITLMLLAAAGFFLMVVAMAPFFKVAKIATWHYAGAIMAIALGFAAVTFEHLGSIDTFLPLSVFVLGVILMKTMRISNETTWVEILAAIATFTRLTVIR